MLLPPSPDDLRAIVRTVGRLLVVLGIGMALLALVALGTGDLDTATALACGAAPAIGFGVTARTVRTRNRRLTWTRGMVAAVSALVAASLVASIPLYLSGQYVSWVDAHFDATSGLTTTGLTLIGDLDHLPPTLVVFRGLLELIGGVAFLMLALSLFSSRGMRASSMEPGSGGPERIMRAPGRLWREVRLVVGVSLAVGLVAVVVALVVAGLPVASLPSTAVSLVAAAATTGGFAPLTGSVGVYHSFLLEAVLVVLMLGAATSVFVHLQADRPALLRRELDARVFATTLVVVVAGVVTGLAQGGTFSQVEALVRHGVFLGIASVTTTGLSTLEPRVLATDIGVLATSSLILGMAIGGMSGSMASGPKAIRIGVLLQGLRAEVRRVLSPDASVHASWFVDRGRRERLTDAHVRSAATILLLTLTAIPIGALALLWSDPAVNLTEAIFTSTSLISNVGLDAAGLRVTDPTATKLLGTGLMILGRLEWLAVFAFVGTLVALVRGRWGRSPRDVGVDAGRPNPVRTPMPGSQGGAP